MSEFASVLRSWRERGESTTFSARLLHEWSNATDAETEVLWVIAPPLPRDLLPPALRG